MSSYKETNRSIDVKGRQETKKSTIDYRYSVKNSGDKPELISFTGKSQDVRVRGFYNPEKDKFSLTKDRGNIESGLEDKIMEAVDDILSEFTDEEDGGKEKEDDK